MLTQYSVGFYSYMDVQAFGDAEGTCTKFRSTFFLSSHPSASRTFKTIITKTNKQNETL